MCEENFDPCPDNAECVATDVGLNECRCNANYFEVVQAGAAQPGAGAAQPEAGPAQPAAGATNPEVSNLSFMCVGEYRGIGIIKCRGVRVCRMYTLSHPKKDRDVTERTYGYTLQDAFFMRQPQCFFLNL